MVRNYGFENMNEFLMAFKECRNVHIDYLQRLEIWQQTCTKSDNSIKAVDKPERQQSKKTEKYSNLNKQKMVREVR